MVALATHHADIDNDDMNALDVLEHPIPGRKGVSTLGAGVDVEHSLAVVMTVMTGSSAIYLGLLLILFLVPIIVFTTIVLLLTPNLPLLLRSDYSMGARRSSSEMYLY